MRQEKRDFGLFVQQLTARELEQLRVDETDSGRLRLVELELERHRMVEAEEARNSPSTPEPAGGNGTVDVPDDVRPDERSLEFDRQMAELVATRRTLALSAAEGDKKASTKLDQIEQEIAAFAVARERAVLAEEESHRRTLEDKRHEEDKKRNQREAHLGDLAAKRLGVAEVVQSDVVALVTHLGSLLEIGAEMENVVLSLGRQGHYLRPRDNVVSYLNTSLAALLPYDFPYPHSSRRGALVEMEEPLLAGITDGRQPEKPE